MFNPIEVKKRLVQERIQKSFDDELEKARSGVYADTAENRKLGRVGQQYGGKKNEEEKGAKNHAAKPSGNEPKGEKFDFNKIGRYKFIESFTIDRWPASDGLGHVFSIENTEGKRALKEDIDKFNKQTGLNVKLEDFKVKTSDGSRYFNLYYNSETGEIANHIPNEWKKEKPFKEYTKYSVNNLLSSFDKYFSGDDDDVAYAKRTKRELKENVEKHGALKVAQSFVKNAIGAEDAEGHEISNNDEAKCAISNIFDEWKVKTDDKTKEFLKYNKKNVWWL